MTRENNISTESVSQKATSSGLPDWMTFPTIAEAFDRSPSNTIAYLIERQKEYQSTEAKGTTADRVRARLISVSYARTCALLKDLETLAESSKNNQPKQVKSDSRSL
jgi:hypothetical protein